MPTCLITEDAVKDLHLLVSAHAQRYEMANNIAATVVSLGVTQLHSIVQLVSPQCALSAGSLYLYHTTYFHVVHVFNCT